MANATFENHPTDPDKMILRKPLYTTPQQRKPLTDEQITKIWEKRPYFNDFARAIEAAHGIKE